MTAQEIMQVGSGTLLIYDSDFGVDLLMAMDPVDKCGDIPCVKIGNTDGVDRPHDYVDWRETELIMFSEDNWKQSAGKYWEGNVAKFRQKDNIIVGGCYTTKWMEGVKIYITCIEQNENKVHVLLVPKKGSRWTEEWDLKHTIHGLERGDYRQDVNEQFQDLILCMTW